MAHSSDCPHPKSETLEEIEFERQSMVDWLHPVELARAGFKAALAATFGSYADKREIQAALAASAEVVHDGEFAPDAPLWFDYVADLGDGFDATYSIARLLAAETLTPEGLDHPTRRGEFLLLGGDQVYPTASRDEYQHRFLGPYRAALPYLDEKQPTIYALPGNHDWYDGLTSFLRIFCQRKRWIGAWQTRQQRSYFALRLPGNWWIWAVDSQLESDLDHPQLLYFGKLVESIGGRDQCAKHKIILLSAEPSWVNCPHDQSPHRCRRLIKAFNTLAFFEKTYIREKGLQLRLALAGDLHHYVRYECRETGTMRITSGGGGAYLLGTDVMPPKLQVREEGEEETPAGEPRRTYRKKKAFPSTRESRELAKGVWKLPRRNRAFGAMLGVIYVVLAWLLHASMVVDAVVFSPFVVAVALLLIGGSLGYTTSKSEGHEGPARTFAIVHGVLQVALCCVLFVLISAVVRWIGFDVLQLAVFVVLLFLSGRYLGCWLFAAFLWVAKKYTGVHAEEIFSSMAIEDYKHFLRMRLDPDGTLTVYAIGLRKVPHDWEFRAPGDEDHGAPWFHSEKFDNDPEYKPHVIERFTLK